MGYYVLTFFFQFILNLKTQQLADVCCGIDVELEKYALNYFSSSSIIALSGIDGLLVRIFSFQKAFLYV